MIKEISQIQKSLNCRKHTSKALTIYFKKLECVSICLSVCLSVRPQSFVWVAKRGASVPIIASGLKDLRDKWDLMD